MNKINVNEIETKRELLVENEKAPSDCREILAVRGSFFVGSSFGMCRGIFFLFGILHLRMAI